MVEHLCAQRVKDALAHPWHEHELQVIADKVQHGDQEKSRADPVQHSQVAFPDGPVDAQFDEIGDAHVGRCVEGHGHHGKDCVPLVGGDVGHQPHHDLVVVCRPNDGFVPDVV